MLPYPNDKEPNNNVFSRVESDGKVKKRRRSSWNMRSTFMKTM